jgi:hypothetical protein
MQLNNTQTKLARKWEISPSLEEVRKERNKRKKLRSAATKKSPAVKSLAPTSTPIKQKKK